MEVKVRLGNNDQELAQQIRDKGFVVEASPVGMRVRLKPDGNGWHFLPCLEIGPITILLNSEERINPDRSVTVVCGISGKPLMPYYIPSTDRQKADPFLGVQGCFSVPEKCVTVTATFGKAVILTVHNAVLSSDFIRVVDTKLWEGAWQKLPPEYDRYWNAVHAAQQKLLCKDCHELHYHAPARAR